jgi:hypothetical protein
MLLIWTLLSFLVGLAASAGNHTQISQGELMTLLGAMPKCGVRLFVPVSIVEGLPGLTSLPS